MNKEKTKKQFILSLAAVVGILVLVLIAFVWGNFVKKDKAPSNSTTDSVVSNSSSEIETIDKTFQLLESKTPTLQGKNGYFTQIENGELVFETEKRLAEQVCNEETAINETTFTGHPIYKVKADLGGDGLAVLNGYGISFLDDEGWMRNLNWVRKEKTGERIYVLRSERELAEYTEAWDKGQAILQGKEMGDKSVIINGRLLSGCDYKEVNGEYYVPLTYIGKAVADRIFYHDTSNMKIILPIQSASGYSQIIIPYRLSAVGSDHIMDDSFFIAGNVSEEYGEVWQEKFRIGDGAECYVPVSELSRYTGWYIYSNGDAISIITDECDVTDNFIVDIQGSQSMNEQIKAGNDGKITINPDDIDTDFVEENADEIKSNTEDFMISVFGLHMDGSKATDEEIAAAKSRLGNT